MAAMVAFIYKQDKLHHCRLSDLEAWVSMAREGIGEFTQRHKGMICFQIQAISVVQIDGSLWSIFLQQPKR
jgi:hypothetical protein